MTDAPPAASTQADTGLDPALVKPSGVGGWLGWFLLTCFLGPFVLVAQTYLAWINISAEQMAYLTALVPGLAVVTGFELTGSLLVGLALFATGMSIVQKRSYAGVLAASVLCLVAVNYAADIVLGEWVAQRLIAAFAKQGITVPYESGVELARELRALLASLLWLWYFFRSKRVRNTFGPVTWQRVGQWLRGRLAEARP